MRKIIFVSLLLFSSLSIFAQDSLLYNYFSYGNPEEGYALMRDYAGRESYDTAKIIAYDLLMQNPAYHDVSLSLARLYGWEGNFDSAYRVVDRVLEGNPDLFEAYTTCTDLAYWNNDWERLESCKASALELDSSAAPFFSRYVFEDEQITDTTAMISGAAVAVTDKENPWTLFGLYTYDHFSQPYVRNWHLLTMGGEKQLGIFTLIPSLNLGYSAGTASPSTDLQLNIDSYVTLGKLNYAMLGYGFSPNGSLNYFPGHRAAAEIWQTLPEGFGISAGMRYFYWSDHFTFLTFSLEKYLGNYMFTFRNYMFFKDNGISGSYFLSARRYFATAEDHLTFTLGYGTAPDEPILVPTDFVGLNALSFRLQYSKALSPVLRLQALVGYSWEEYQPEVNRHRIDFSIGAFYKLGK